MTAPSQPAPAGAGRNWVFALLTAALIAALFGLDFTLAKLQNDDLQSRAQRLFEQGTRLLKGGRAEAALDPLRSAYTLERKNGEYQLALVDALLGAHKLDQAGDLLRDLLSSDPNGGDANLMMARLRVRQGQKADAESYYHRAIYGVWPAHAEEHRLEVRMELVKLFEDQSDQKGLLAELLPLDNEVHAGSARMNLAKLYERAGSPGRSAQVYRSLLEADPRNAEALTGLGIAELALGDYRAAMGAFVNAYRQNPNDSSARGNIELSSAMTALDPTPRRLGSAEKLRRSTRILELARSAMQSCAGQHGIATTDDLGRADVLLARTQPAAASNEMSEERLALAEQLWSERVKSCGPAASPQEQPLLLIMEKLAR